MSEKQKTYVDERLRGKGTAKRSGKSEGNVDAVSHTERNPKIHTIENTSSQEFPPQSKEKLREMFAQSISDDFEKGYKIVDTMINGYKQQAREEMLKEIPCPQMSMESIFNCSCCWCKSLKETWLGEEVLKEK